MSSVRDRPHTHQTGSSCSSHLSVVDLWKSYSTDAPVLRGVSLEVEKGTLTAVLGLSGCGKTTLLRVIAGFERADAGSLRLGDRVLDDGQHYLPPEHRGIGYMPQEGALFPHLSVQANVAFGLSRSERRSKTVSNLLEMVSIAHLARRFPHELSGGEQQRVALARALARAPQVLLLDEPFSSLDASLRTAVRDEVSALLRSQGATTVLVTHDQEEALSLADSVAVLRDGTIVQHGSPSELYSQPSDVTLAGFLGAANMITAIFDGDVASTALGALTLRPTSAPPPLSERGMVMVRPEQLEVHAGKEAIGGLAGEIVQCRYYGHDALLYIRPDEPVGQEILIARVPGELALASGTSVTLSACGPVSVLIV